MRKRVELLLSSKREWSDDDVVSVLFSAHFAVSDLICIVISEGCSQIFNIKLYNTT